MKVEIIFKDGRKEIFDGVASFTVTEEHAEKQETNENEVRPAENRPSVREVAKIPCEGKLFEVNLLGMDRRLFKKKRGNAEQERRRQIINEAFAEVDKRIQEYAEPFYTLIPEKKWGGYKTADELMRYAEDLGGQTADWIQQALECAQRICNGETWEAVCNDIDTAKWFRMIVWKNGFYRLVGGSCFVAGNESSSNVDKVDYSSFSKFCSTVPLVAIKKKK